MRVINLSTGYYFGSDVTIVPRLYKLDLVSGLQNKQIKSLINLDNKSQITFLLAVPLMEVQSTAIYFLQRFLFSLNLQVSITLLTNVHENYLIL